MGAIRRCNIGEYLLGHKISGLRPHRRQQHFRSSRPSSVAPLG
jgi:hypothetical protein